MRSILGILTLGIGLLITGCGSKSSASPSPSTAANPQAFCDQAKTTQAAVQAEGRLISSAGTPSSQQSQDLVNAAKRVADLTSTMARSAPSDVLTDANYLAGIADGIAKTIEQSKGDLANAQAQTTILAQDPVFTMHRDNLSRYLASHCGISVSTGP